MKKIISILLVIALLLTMTACSSGSAEPAAEASSQETAKSSFMASGEGEDATEPEQLVEPDKEPDPQPIKKNEILVIAESDLGSNFEFGYNNDGFTLVYPNSGNEYQMAWYNDDIEIESAFHDVYGCHYILKSNEERKTKEFYYTTSNGSLGNSIHYVNLETREDRFVAQGILYEALSYGYFNGRLIVWIDGINVKNGLEEGYYIYETDGTMLTYVGLENDETFIKTGEHEKREKPQVPVEPKPQPEPEKPLEPEPEPAKPIVVSEKDVLLVNEEYQFDLSGDGKLETFEFVKENDNQPKLVVNGASRVFQNIEPDLLFMEYRIIDLNPADPYKDLEIIEAAPPYEQSIHFVRIKDDRGNSKIEYYGPLTVACEDYENDRVLYQGNDKILVIEMSKIVTAFYQKFYELGYESVTDISRPDITKYMQPYRTTLNKDIWAFPTSEYTDSGAVYLNAGDQIIIHGESEGNLWIEYLGEASSEFLWLLGNTITHQPDNNGQYLFTGVQFWS